MNKLPNEVFQGIQRGTERYHYRGVLMQKNPVDLAIQTALLWEVKPRTIIEIGACAGGSALWMRDHMRLFGVYSMVYSIDINPPPFHGPINGMSFHLGDGKKLGEVLSDEFMTGIPRPLLVIEDADHSRGTSEAVLDFFDKWLVAGEYIIVEDGYATATSDNSPLDAIRAFMERRGDSYEIERKYCDMFGITGNPDGYIRRIR